MKVLLRRNVESVGQAGEIKDVRDGYARNYLLPRKLAVPVGKATTESLQQRALHLERKDATSAAAAEEAAARMRDLRIQIQAKVGEGTKLFGSVTHAQIQEALSKKGILVDRRKIEFDDHIRSLGTYTIPVKLYEGVTGEFTLEVVAEE